MIYLADADSTIPNLALMRLGAHFRARGERVRLVRPSDRRTLFDTPGDVYGSSIFAFSDKARKAIEREWGYVRWGGTGVNVTSSLAEVDASVDWDTAPLDYSLYPDFKPSLGFLMRGCRLRCGFCVVPRSEGKPRAVASVRDVWRGDGHPRRLLLLDNDPFATELRSHWFDAIREIREGNFKVCWNQGINLRLVDDESAGAIASVQYRDNEFKERRLYTAWDNLRDEDTFRRGVETLRRAGVPPSHLMVYMLVGYRAEETWEDVFYRFRELVSLGCRPYPMVFDRRARPDLCAFQRWVLTGLYRAVPWPDYREGGARLNEPARSLSDSAWKRVACRGAP